MGVLQITKQKEAVASYRLQKVSLPISLASLIVIELTCNTKSYLAWLLVHVLTQSLSTSGSAWFSSLFCMLSAQGLS